MSALIRDYQGRLRLERMHAVRDKARTERDGRRYSTGEVLALIQQTPARDRRPGYRPGHENRE
ncbi:hypothetical protein [uncultured Aeromicrobium sp.]|uniref:hypothetical protein n=1 Tax=uncultured Aeromicrobium sp. TaxID=337820 RepID=UPI0025E5B089|nr:hypothetical protein [uncultured Aeromicrobium sp.]